MQKTALLLVITTLTLAACGNAGGGSVPCDPTVDDDCPTATPPPVLCAYPSGRAPGMLYPSEGATNVPDNFPGVTVVDATSSLQTWLPASGNYYYADLFTHPATFVDESNFSGPQSSGFTQFGPTTNLMQLSSGAFTAGGPVMPHTHYYVYLEYSYQDGSGNSCYANGPIGDFTTQ